MEFSGFYKILVIEKKLMKLFKKIYSTQLRKNHQLLIATHKSYATAYCGAA